MAGHILFVPYNTSKECRSCTPNHTPTHLILHTYIRQTIVMTAKLHILLVLVLLVSIIVPLTNAHPNYNLRTLNEHYPSTIMKDDYIVSEDKETRKLFPPVGAVGDDIAKVGGKKAPWDILFTEGFEECKNDEGCRAFAPIFITLIIMMVCVSGYSCYNNDRKDRIVTAQEEQNNS